MNEVFYAVAILALLVAAVALLACSALLRTVREIQRDLRAGGLAAPVATVAEFASPDGRPTHVLAVSAHCDVCEERASQFHLTATPEAHLVLLGPVPEVGDWLREPNQIRVVADPALLGRVAPSVTPMLITYAADGTEQGRRVVGSQGELVQAVRARAS